MRREGLLTTDETAEWLNIPPRTIERWRYVGTGPEFVRLPKGVRYTPEALRAFIASRTRGGDREAA